MKFVYVGVDKYIVLKVHDLFEMLYPKPSALYAMK